jgi:DNA-3-methyladenine glycosylase II
MFLMFTLRRPDILPVGDLGVQKGLLKWVLAVYDSCSSAAVESSEVVRSTKEEGKEEEPKGEMDSSIVPTGIEKGDQLVPASSATNPSLEPTTIPSSTQTVTSPSVKNKVKKSVSSSTPSGLEKQLLTLEPGRTREEIQEMFPLPEGLDLGLMRSRLGGKKAK